MNELYSTLNGQTPPPMANLENAIAQIKANPGAILKQAGLVIPDGMNTPPRIINYLMQSGQLNQNRLAQVQQSAMRYKR